MSELLEFNELSQEFRGHMYSGRLKLHNSVIFRFSKSGKVQQYQGTDIKSASWLLRARGCCLKVLLKSGVFHRYDGFQEADFDKVSKYLSSNFDIPLTKEDISTKGWNWGASEFVGNALDFKVDGKTSFEVPLNNVWNSTVNKNEVGLTFHPNDDAAVCMVSMRFHVPSNVDDPTDDIDPVGEFRDRIMEHADVIKTTGNVIASFSGVQCLTPRGRYDIRFYTNFVEMHGKSFDFKTPYHHILRSFLLPHKDGRQMFFVIALDPPVQQGQTRYPFIVLLYPNEDEVTIELGMDDEELTEKGLEKEMTGPEHEVTMKIVEKLCGNKTIGPAREFKGTSGTKAIACSHKTATGLLYPLDRGFIYVYKPALHFRFSEIASVNFGRSQGSTRSFDFDIETKIGPSYTFSSIEKDEYSPMFDFIKSKNLRIRNLGDKAAGNVGDLDESSGDEEPDYYAEKMKAEGKNREDSDSDDADDSDFDPGKEGGEGDASLDYDSNASSSSSSEGGSDSDSKKKKAEKKPTPKKSAPKKRSIPNSAAPGKKKKRAKRDPNMPKRPMSGFMIFMNENRERIKNENPDVKFTDIAKLAGEEWKALSDKSEYDAKYKESVEKYKVAMKEYEKMPKPQVSEEAKSPPKKKSQAPKSSSPRKGGQFKSKEYVNSSDDSSSDDDDKPLQRSFEKEDKKKDGGDDSDKTEEDDFGELPSDESSASETGGSGSESEEEEEET